MTFSSGMTVPKLRDKRAETITALATTAMIRGHCGQTYLNTRLKALIQPISPYWAF
jgi:hypothetical protein